MKIGRFEQMALIGIDTVAKQIVARIYKLGPPQGIEILSYKRNRGVTLLLVNRNTVLIRERGYMNQEFQVDLANLEKPLKSAIKREFPRSRKLRIYNIAGPGEMDKPRKKL